MQKLHGYCQALRVSAARLVKLLYDPEQALVEISASPNLSGPATFVVLSSVVHFLIFYKIMTMMCYEQGESIVSLLSASRVNLAIILLLKVSSIIPLWFLSFIVYWFVMHLLGSDVEGYTVFSAVGMLISIQLIFFSLDLLLYCIADVMSPCAVIAVRKGLYPEALLGSSLMLRFYSATPAQPLLLYYVDAFFRNVSFVLMLVLSVILVRVLGTLSWKKSTIGGSASYGVMVLMSWIFHISGVL